jgi:hypothetical protein
MQFSRNVESIPKANKYQLSQAKVATVSNPDFLPLKGPLHLVLYVLLRLRPTMNDIHLGRFGYSQVGIDRSKV